MIAHHTFFTRSEHFEQGDLLHVTYQMQAIAALLKTGQSDPQIPNDARLVTGKEI